MMDRMGRSKRHSSPRARKAQPDRGQPPAELQSLAQRVSQMSPSEVLERIRRARVAQQEAETELAALVDHAVGLAIGWPEIADQLGVTRQAARQHYQRRHSEDASRRDRTT
jgi:predicted transcriptional regulator